MDSYQQLQDHFRRISQFQHLGAIAQWDQATMMATGGNAARGSAMAELDLLVHTLCTDPNLQDWFDNAERLPLQAEQQANIKEMKRRWLLATALPADLVKAKAIATSHCEHAWRTQRKNNDWNGFKSNLSEVLKLAREEANVRAEKTGLSQYDALLDIYEPGMSSAKIDVVFDDVKSWLPDLIRQVEDHQAQSAQWIAPKGPFPIELQKALGTAAMTLLGFDFDHGRLDVSAHPFCGGVPTDVRITTRYDESDFMTSLLGVIHETGHARYEQNLPKEWAGLPVGEARSMGIHESQSLFFEMQLARSREFTELLAPMAAKLLGRGNDSAFSVDNIYAFNTRVKKGFIRVNADELTYPAHVMLRYEIERALIEGTMEVDDIPDVWDNKMQAYLGLSTKDNFSDGCMQDIHWPGGSFGYFPSYTLGAMYAAQQFAAAERAMPSLRQDIQNGNLNGLFERLKHTIWLKASTLETEALLKQATGSELQSHYFKKHLETRYLTK